MEYKNKDIDFNLNNCLSYPYFYLPRLNRLEGCHSNNCGSAFTFASTLRAQASGSGLYWPPTQPSALPAFRDLAMRGS
jgi:hypothetical protein